MNLFYNRLIYVYIFVGAKFKRHAAVILPLFRRAKIISNFDVIVDCVDKLLDNWHEKPRDYIHTDIIPHTQNLVLQIFGMIAFDYDLQTLDYSQTRKESNQLTKALNDMLSVLDVIYYTPKTFAKIYLKLNLRYQRARQIIEKHLNRMIEQELSETPESRAERKRTSLIASLVHSLQNNEKAEAMKNEEDRRGKSLLSISIL